MAEVLLKARSPLATVSAHAAPGLSIREDGGFTLTQVAGFGKAFEKDLAAVVGKLPAKIGIANQNEAFTVLRIAPQQFWCLGNEPLPAWPSTCLLTPLSSSRCRMELEGERARHVLARCAPLDFRLEKFGPGQFAMTGLHHTPVLIHCVAGNTFHLYAMRTFAMAVWEWVVDAANGQES